jgi:two-component system OmpR family sensor kinase
VTSIRRRLLVWLLSAVVAGGLAATVVVFLQARQELNLIFDYQLRQLALTLRDRTYWPRQLEEALQGEEALEFLIQVWSADGTLLYASHPEYTIPAACSSASATCAPRTAAGASSPRSSAASPCRSPSRWRLRDKVAFMAALRTMLPFLAALPLMGFLIWVLVGRELRSLESTTRAVARRSPESLEPIETREAPVEIQPLVTALNGLLARLEGALGGSASSSPTPPTSCARRSPRCACSCSSPSAPRTMPRARRRTRGCAKGSRAPCTWSSSCWRSRARIPMRRWSRPARSTSPLLVRGTAEAHEPAAAARDLGLVVEAAEPIFVVGDRAALRTLVDNLIDNATRYTPSGRVAVRVMRDGPDAVLEVEDTGPGIPPADRARAFDRFYRGESTTEGGTGLGLAIVKRIAERHGGTAELLDPRQGRAAVRIALPAAPRPP